MVGVVVAPQFCDNVTDVNRLLETLMHLPPVILCGRGTMQIYYNPALVEVTYCDSDADANRRKDVVTPATSCGRDRYMLASVTAI
jgi:hypothetical protein